MSVLPSSAAGRRAGTRLAALDRGAGPRPRVPGAALAAAAAVAALAGRAGPRPRYLPALPGALVVIAGAWALAVALVATGRDGWFGHAGPPAPLAAGWLVMTVAMMGPAGLPMMRYVAANTLVPGRAVAAYAGGQVAGWAAFLAAFGLLDALAHAAATPGASGATPGASGAAAAVAVAAGWQLTPWRRAALRTCRRVGVPPAHRGPAERAALRLGLRHGAACVTSCAPLMLATMALPAGRLPAMGAVALLAWLEKAGGLGDRLARPVAAALVSLAVALAVT